MMNARRLTVHSGLISRQTKPVYWSPSSHTALAEAELEYDDNHHCVAAFVKFPLVELPDLLRKDGRIRENDVSALIWTTTPWTLPANEFIGIRSDIIYQLVEVSGEGQTGTGTKGQLLVAADRVESLKSHLPDGQRIDVLIEAIPGSSLASGGRYVNPISGRSGRLVHADFVTSISGTGLVHMAPGHGMEDYAATQGLRDGPVFAPVDDMGRFTEDSFPHNPEVLKGLAVEKDGAKAVIELLRNPSANLSSTVPNNNSLIFATHNFKHKNPIDWRTKQPVIVRATQQWFADVGTIQEGALEALEQVEFIPQNSKARLQNFVKGRSQWCISRQRSWGLPIPALFRKDNGQALMTTESIEHIINVIEERGTDVWWSDAADDPVWIPEGLEQDAYYRGKDTMDVWFDSGSTWTCLSPRTDRPVADAYIEGTDQHRGWFQSSLLTHVAAGLGHGKALAPFKTLITHGFTLDHEGRKMSKSIGNVVTPEEILSGTLAPIANGKSKGPPPAPLSKKNKGDPMGPDVLRLWVASSDYTKDVVISQATLQSIHQNLQKYRVTFKWLLGVLGDYPANGPVPTLMDDLSFADQIVLERTFRTAAFVWEANNKYEFHKSINAINKFVNADLSAFYFEVAKDRMYAGNEDVRRHTQTILYLVLNDLMHMLTPITPHLVEEVWAHVPEEASVEYPHPLHRIWDSPWQPNIEGTNTAELDERFAIFQRISGAVKSAQEEARRSGKLGSGLASAVEILMPQETDGPIINFLADLESGDELRELLIVSEVMVLPLDPEARAQLEEVGEEGDEENVLALLLQARKQWRDNVAWSQEIEFECGTEGNPVQGKVIVLPAAGKKCVRCWQYVAPAEDGLCARCEDVLGVRMAPGGGQGEDGEEDEEDDGDEDDYSEREPDFEPPPGVRNDLEKYR